MAVQITPFQGSNLAQVALQGAQLREQRERNDALMDLQERRLAAEEARTQRLTDQQRLQAAQLIPQAIQEAIQASAGAPTGRAQRFRAAILPFAQAAVEQKIAGPELLEGIAQVTDEDLVDPQAAMDAFSAEYRSFLAESDTLGLSEEDRQQAGRVRLGLAPRPVGNANITLASGQAGVTPEQVAGAAGTVRAGEEAGKSAIEQSNEAIKQLGSVKRSITNIDDAIKAIDAGANTGAIASRLPSVRAASIELDNIRGRMGLDVVGATTFGALSEAELQFALDTALPTGMDQAQLRQWLERKKQAQQKLAAELEGAAIFLGQPGNTPADYLQLLRDNGGLTMRGEQAAPTGGGLTAQDGDIVQGPDGKQYRVQGSELVPM